MAYEGLWTDSAYIASSFAGGRGTEEDPYLINTAAQLAYLSQRSCSGESFSDVYFKLTSDINLTGHYWVPIGGNGTGFDGYFDGDLHTISNMCIDTAELNNASYVTTYIGLFGYITSLTPCVNNLCVSNAQVRAREGEGTVRYTSVVIGYILQTHLLTDYYTNIKVENSIVEANGGIAASIIANPEYYIELSNIEILSCYISCTAPGDSFEGIGILCGKITQSGLGNSTFRDINIRDCHIIVWKLSAEVGLGGLVGVADAGSRLFFIERVSLGVTISGLGSSDETYISCAGFAGSFTDNSNKNSLNTVDKFVINQLITDGSISDARIIVKMASDPTSYTHGRKIGRVYYNTDKTTPTTYGFPLTASTDHYIEGTSFESYIEEDGNVNTNIEPTVTKNMEVSKLLSDTDSVMCTDAAGNVITPNTFNTIDGVNTIQWFKLGLEDPDSLFEVKNDAGVSQTSLVVWAPGKFTIPDAPNFGISEIQLQLYDGTTYKSSYTSGHYFSISSDTLVLKNMTYTEGGSLCYKQSDSTMKEIEGVSFKNSSTSVLTTVSNAKYKTSDSTLV